MRELKNSLKALKRYVKNKTKIEVPWGDNTYTFSRTSGGALVIKCISMNKEEGTPDGRNLSLRAPVGHVTCLILSDGSKGKFYRANLVKTQAGEIAEGSRLNVRNSEVEANELLNVANAVAKAAKLAANTANLLGALRHFFSNGS